MLNDGTTRESLPTEQMHQNEYQQYMVLEQGEEKDPIMHRA